MQNLEKLGLRVDISPHASRRHGHASGIPEERAEDLMSAFMDSRVGGIMAVWGGWNSNDIIDLLDYKEILNHPKIFVGYSDITTLNVVLLEKARLVSFMGATFVTFTHPHLMGWEVKDFKEAIMSTAAPREINAAPTYIDDPNYFLHPDKPPIEVPNSGWVTHRRGIAEGRLLGSHLGTLLCLAGTPYWPDFRGKILIVEEDEDGGPAGNIARKFRQLKQTGALNDIKAMLVGRIPSVAGLKESDSLEMILEETLNGYDFPLVSGVDFGHTNPIATLPMGIKAKLDTEKGKLVLLEAGVKK